MFDQLRLLYEAELWSSIAQVAPHALAFYGSEYSKTDCEMEPPASGKLCRKRQQIVVMVADSFLALKEYKKAESLFKEAIQLRKQFKSVKRSGGSANDSSEDHDNIPVSLVKPTSDVEIKYKLHLCYMNTNQSPAAVNTLQCIPAKQRTPKCNLALGKLYQQAEMERPAIGCFREVLKVCPLCLEAAEALMQMGVKSREIGELTLEASTGSGGSMDWLNQWSMAYAAFANRDYPTAITNLKQLEDTKPLLRNNIQILVTLGQAQHYSGNFTAALQTLQRVHKLDPNHLSCMDILAALYAKDRKVKELEQLAVRLMSVTEESPEPWIAMGYYSYVNKKGAKAMYFGHKAIVLSPRSVEALLLKGNLLLDMKKLMDAMNHFREAVQIAPYRYETHKGLVDCYLAQSRHREAVSVATAACKQLNNSARALTLFATVLSKDPLHMSLAKAKNLLEKALAADQYYLPAVYLLAEILEQEVDHEKAIELLKKQIAHQPTGKLHQMMADLLAKTHEEEKAMEHYSIALNLDPKNQPAQEGLQKMEQATDKPLDLTYELEEEIEMNSDDADLEESETEAVWSDGDLNLASSNASF